MLDDRYEVRLENIFEGPMDLLVYLIQKNEVDVYDIPIALITDQYLGYIELMKALNIDVAGDFILMAATLTQIKSRMLLPAAPADDPEAEDPRMEITRPLLEYLRMKSAADALAQRHLLGQDIFLREPVADDVDAEPEDIPLKLGLLDLIDAFQRVLDTLPGTHRLDFSDEGISVKDRITELIDQLETHGAITFDQLFSDRPTKGEIIVTFMAILEMARIGLIEISQGLQSGIIRIIYL
jgi:segregation and condensation protein A